MAESKPTQGINVFANDGSFLEKFKKMQQEKETKINPSSQQSELSSTKVGQETTTLTERTTEEPRPPGTKKTKGATELVLYYSLH